MKLNHKYSLVFSALLIAFVLLPLFGEGGGKEKKMIKVACIGDSITFGARLDNPENDSYPARLQKLFGEKYLVENFGVGSCTLIRKGIPTVWDQLSLIKAAAPDIVVISLGTNDTCGMESCGDRRCWEYKDEFEGDYSDLIDTLKTWPSQPKIWICAPSPMVLETPGLSAERIQGLTIREPRLQELIGLIKKVAENKNVGFIDLNTPLKGKPELFTEQDGVHPNKDGYFAIAKLVYREVKKEN
jgi:lysophospholipase L1-like esterase